jgi:hypothetical protein
LWLRVAGSGDHLKGLDEVTVTGCGQPEIGVATGIMQRWVVWALLGFVWVATQARSAMADALATPPPSAGPADAPGAGPSEFSPVALIRPHGGIGYMSTLGGPDTGVSYHLGGRVLLPAFTTHRFGLEVTYVDPRVGHGRSSLLAVGIVLEQILFGWFHMGIGTVGYVDLHGRSPHPFGIVACLGYEPARPARLSPYAVQRSDWVFASRAMSITSVSVGPTLGL